MPRVHAGSRTKITWSEEATYGTTSNGTYRSLPYLAGETLANDVSQFTSETLNATRMVGDIVTGQRNPGGSIPFEFMTSGYTTFIKHLLLGTTNVVGSGPYDLSIYGRYQRDTNRIKEGLTIRKYFLSDGEATPFMLEYTGCKINSMSLDVPTDGIVTGSFDIISLLETIDSSPGTPTANEPEQNVFTSIRLSKTSPFIGYVWLSPKGADPTYSNASYKLGTVQSANLNITNNAERVAVIGSTASYAIEFGRREITGSLSIVLADPTQYERFLNETVLELRMRFDARDGQYIEFWFPKMQFGGLGGGGVTAPQVSQEGPLSLELPFQALMAEDIGLVDGTIVDTDVVVNIHVNTSGILAY